MNAFVRSNRADHLATQLVDRALILSLSDQNSIPVLKELFHGIDNLEHGFCSDKLKIIFMRINDNGNGKEKKKND